MMRMMSSFLLVMTCLALAVAQAQTGKLFTVDSDLSSSMVMDIHQDRDGFIWIATEDGLNRFDGHKFTIYRQDKGNETTILNDMVRVLFEDKQGKMFVGYINGLQYYDSSRDAFYHVPLMVADGSTVDAHVKSIFQRENGQILVGTSGHGVFELKWDGNALSGYRISSFVTSNMIVKIFEDRHSNLWVSTEDGGLFKCVGSDEPMVYFSSKKAQNNVVSSICEDRYGTLWIGNMASGLFRYDPIKDVFVQMPYIGFSSLSISDLWVGSDNTLYIACDGQGVKYFDAELGYVTDMDSSVGSFNFAKAKTNSILEDRAGNIWVGLYQKGVFLIPSHNNSFGYIGHKSINRNLIGSNSVMSVFEDSGGSVWVGTDNDGLYELSNGLKTSRFYGNKQEGHVVPSTVMSIFEDSQKELWVGSYSDGLLTFDKNTRKFVPLKGLIDKNGDNVQRIFDVVEDDQQGLWIASMGSGLFNLNLRSGLITHFDAKEESSLDFRVNSLPNDWINCLRLSRNKKLFIGTYDGLGCFDLESKDFVSTLGANRLFVGSVVYSLYDDERGNLWVGTSKGLKKLNLFSLEVTEYSTENGLPSNIIWAIEGDKRGNIWVSTNQGVSKMDIREERFLNFYASDGLQGNEFMRGVSLISKSGALFFGGINGLTYFNPNEMQLASKDLSVYVVDFYIRDKAVRKGMKSGRFTIVDTAINHAEKFHLAHYDNSFTMEFSTMDFSDSERITFQYSLNNQDWIPLRPLNNRIAFDNLDPGKHKLRVRAKADEAYSGVRELTIVVHPIWFQSTVAKWLYLCLALVLAGLTIRIVRNRQHLRKEMLARERAEEINEAKLQFFINIAHEIRTPLSLIVSPLEKLNNCDDEEPGRKYLYGVMDRNVHRVLDLVNQLMDIQKIEKGLMNLSFTQVDLVKFTQEICSLFEEQVEAKEIQFVLECPTGAMPAYIDPRNFDKVLINLLSNAFKFTPIGGEIKISLIPPCSVSTIEEQFFTIAVMDSGRQINEKEADKLFNCFYQSEAHQDYNGYGTGIGLHLAKQLTELHRGEIHVENVVGGGCRFIVKLPTIAQIDLITQVEEHTPSRVQKITPVLDMHEQNSINKKRKAKKIAIVDDDFEILDYLRHELSSTYTVLCYTDGNDAYQGIMAQLPDLIISDIVMPSLDGLSLCSKIKRNSLINHIPLILLSAKTESAANIDGLESGADAYLTKPFNIDVLLNTVKSAIRNRELIKNNHREAQFEDVYISNIEIKSADEKLLEKVHLIIEENLDNPRLSVEMIASAIGISRVHLHRKLKELTNLTTRDLIRGIRLKQAAKLIVSKRLNVSEVAYAVGYTELSKFSAAFKQLFGMTPTAYGSRRDNEMIPAEPDNNHDTYDTK